MQETFLKAWAALDGFKGEAKVSTWLYRIATNESLSFLARKRSSVALDDTDVERTLQSDSYFDGDELQIQLQQAISQLPDKQRLVFNMKYYEQMTELPSWAKPTIQKVIDKGVLKGDGSGLHLSEENMKMFIYMDRLGLIT